MAGRPESNIFADGRWSGPSYPDSGAQSGAGPADQATSTGGGRPAPELPPKAGPGSTRAKWLAYAASRGVNLPQTDASREDIIAACEAANVPTE